MIMFLGKGSCETLDDSEDNLDLGILGEGTIDDAVVPV